MADAAKQTCVSGKTQSFPAAHVALVHGHMDISRSARVDAKDIDALPQTKLQKAQRLFIIQRRKMKKGRHARIGLQWRQSFLKLLDHFLKIVKIDGNVHLTLNFFDLNEYHLIFSS